MIYTFSETIFKQGNRHFLKIPFNVWDECGQKGMISIKAYIQDIDFECRLVSKGNGIYYIPIHKNVMSNIQTPDEITISFEIISDLTRINHDSPYSLKNPIRKIDTIHYITYPKDGYCGQLCVAMLTGLDVDEIIDIMQAKAWQCSISKLLETLDYFGIAHDKKFTYTKGKEVVLPKCCIVNVKRGMRSHLALYYQGKYYDSIQFDADKIISYISIHI